MWAGHHCRSHAEKSLKAVKMKLGHVLGGITVIQVRDGLAETYVIAVNMVNDGPILV